MRHLTKVGAIASAALCAAFANAQIQVQVDGNAVVFPNAQPQYVNGRVLVPLRGVFEQLGASVDWMPSSRMVVAHKGNKEVDLKIGSANATVDGTPTELDVPAMIINGTTMVPIRFVSEALGAQVGWMEANQLVTITTNDTTTEVIQAPRQHLRRVVIQADEVIPVWLDQRISTVDNHRGDTFTATINTHQANDYADIPRGTKVEGHIAAIHPRNGNRPAVIDLSFDKVDFPNGRQASIDGVLTSLDDKYVTQNDDGRLVARHYDNDQNQNQKMVYAGYGAGAGLLVGVLDKKPIEGALLGGALGYILGQVQQGQHMNSNITLAQGTQMGVRVNRDITVGW